MSLILKQIFQLFKMLNSETGTNQIAAGVAAGFILGMTPEFSLQTILVFLCIIVFRIQAGAAFATAFFFAMLAYFLDPVFHLVGSSALEAQALQGIYTQLYNMPIVPFTKFNNSIVMGAGIIGLVCAPFVFIVSKALIVKYRVTLLARFKESKAWKAIQATTLYKWYHKYEEFYG